MQIISFFSGIFGFALNHIYILVENYGVAIILFSILLKLVMLPLSINQQITRRKTSRLQGKVKEIQQKYKKDTQKAHMEVMALYKSEKMNPLSGCLGAIVQIILLFAMFLLVRSPLTHMKNIDPVEIDNFANYIRQEVRRRCDKCTISTN